MGKRGWIMDPPLTAEKAVLSESALGATRIVDSFSRPFLQCSWHT